MNGRIYKDLPEQIRRGIDRRYLSSIILLQETAKDEREAEVLKQLVFERINSGGVRLEPQESRNAIYPGGLNSLCIALSRDAFLCKMWGIPEPDSDELEHKIVRAEVLANPSYQKMDDVELVLRFFAHRQRLANQQGALRTYLDRYLQVGNLFSPTLLGQFKQLFSETVSFVFELFGEKAFWLLRKRGETWGWYQRPTTVIYDPLMFVCSRLLAHRNRILQQRQVIVESIPEFYKQNYGLLEGRYTNLSNINDRNENFAAFFAMFVE